MKTGKSIFGITMLLIISSCQVNQQNDMKKFTGMWKLDKYESLDTITSKWYPSPKRVGYTGYILYDGMGHMAAQLLPPGFKDFDNSKNIDSLNNMELKKIVNNYYSSFDYVATCKITDDGKSIEHYKLSSNNPKEWGTSVKRDIEFKGDTLILTAKELIGSLKTRLRWVKVE
jgi:Lipocalin-like domain